MTDRSARIFSRVYKAAFVLCLLFFTVFMVAGYSGFRDVSVLLFSSFEFLAIFLAVLFVLTMCYQVFRFFRKGEDMRWPMLVFFFALLVATLFLLFVAIALNAVSSGDVFMV